MIKPVNGHLLIEPLRTTDFVATSRESYQEVGIVVSRDLHLTGVVEEGDKVYFDSWLAAKYPKVGGSHDEYYWLVKWEDVRAIEEGVELSAPQA